MTRRERRAQAALEAAFEQAAVRLAGRVTQAVADRAVVVVAAGEPVQFNPDDAYRIEWWVNLVAELIDPAMRDAALAAFQAAASRMGLAFDLVSPFLEEAVLEQLEAIVDFAEGQRQFIAAELQDGMRKGWSVDDLVKRLREHGDSPLNPDAARRVAQTEMIGAQNAANVATYQASGLTGTVRWMSTPDSHTRPSHVAANGQERRVGEPFEVGGHPARWPADPRLPTAERINCRCRVTFEPDLVQPQAEQTTVQLATGGIIRPGQMLMIGERPRCVLRSVYFEEPPTVRLYDARITMHGDHNQKDHAGGGAHPQETPQKPAGGAPRVIADEGEAKEFLGRYDDWKAGLSDGEDRAMRFYQSPGYALMNGELRGGKGSVDAPDADLKRARQATKNLKAAIAKAPPLDEPLTVWRGMSAEHFGGPMEPGQSVSDRGFTSTALYRKGVASVAESGEQVVAEIRLPAGTRAAAGSARELVLPPDAEFRVVSKKGRNVVLEYQLPKPKGKAVGVTVRMHGTHNQKDHGRGGGGPAPSRGDGGSSIMLDEPRPKVTRDPGEAVGSGQVTAGDRPHQMVVDLHNAYGMPVLPGTVTAKPKVLPEPDARNTAERTAMYDWTGALESRAINAELRSGGPKNRQTPEITRVLDRTAIEDDVTVYRGVKGVERRLRRDRGLVLKVGMEFTDHGFTSTDVIGATAERMGNQVMAIRVPKGTKAAYFQTPFGEQELMLQRGTRFRVVGTVQAKNGPRAGQEVFHVEVVGQDTPNISAATRPVTAASDTAAAAAGRDRMADWTDDNVEVTAPGITVDGWLTARAATVTLYNSAQPRAKDGKWTKGGGGGAPDAGGGGGGHANRGATNPGGVDDDYDRHLGKVQEVYNDFGRYEMMRDQYDTVYTHKDRDGNWTPERQALQQRILDEFDQRHRNVPTNGEVIVTGGLGGAGKTTILKMQADRLGITFDGDNATSHATVNPDDFKEIMFKHGMIPDVPGFTPAEASTFVHNEAKELSDRATERLMARNANVIYDFTMSSQRSITTRVEPFLAAGYKAKAVFVDVSVGHARDAAEGRHRRGFEKFKEGTDRFGGRFVPGYAYAEATPPKGSPYRSTNRYFFEKWKDSNPEIRTLTVDNDRYQTRIVDDQLAGRRGGVDAVPHLLVQTTRDQSGVERPVDLLGRAGLRPRVRIVAERATEVGRFDRGPRMGGEHVDEPGGVGPGVGDHARHVGGAVRFHTPDYNSPLEAVVCQSSVFAAGADGSKVYTGAMVALAVPPGLAIRGPEALAPGELHITLRYLGDSTMFGVTDRARIVELVDHAAGGQPPFRVRISGWGRLGDQGAVVVYVEAQALNDIHGRIAAAVPAAPDAHPGFTPHFTLAYGGDPDVDALDSMIGTQFLVDRLLVWFGSTVTSAGMVIPGPGSTTRPLAAPAATAGTVQLHGSHNQKDHAGRWTMKDYPTGGDFGPPPWGSNKSVGVKAAKDAKAMAEHLVATGQEFTPYTVQTYFEQKFGKDGFKSDDGEAFQYYVNANQQRLADVHYATARLKDKSPEHMELIEAQSQSLIYGLAEKGSKLTGANLEQLARSSGMSDEQVADVRSWFVNRASTTWVYYNEAKKAHAEGLGFSGFLDGKGKKAAPTAGSADLALKAKKASIEAALADEMAKIKAAKGGGEVIDVGSPKPKPNFSIADMDEVDALKAKGMDMDKYDLSDVPPHKPKVADALDEMSAAKTWQSLTPGQKSEAETYAEAAVAKLKADGKEVSIAALKEQFGQWSTSKVSQGAYALVSAQPAAYGLGGQGFELTGGKVSKATATGSKATKKPAAPGFDPEVVSGKNSLGLPVLKGTKDAMKIGLQEVDYGEPGGQQLLNYHGTGYEAINGRLRDGKKPNATDAALTKLIHQKTVPEDITVYRGMHSIDQSKFKPGMVFTDHGFSSTDIYGEKGKSFSGGQVFMAIHVPKGTKAAYKHNHHNERELLIQRGTTYQVVGQIADPVSGNSAWHVEVVAQPMWKAENFGAVTPRLGETGVIDKFGVVRIMTLHSAQRAVIMAGSETNAYARRIMRHGKEDQGLVTPEFVITADPDPDNWGPLDVPVDDDSGHEDRIEDWSFDTLDVHFPGYDTQDEADADAEDRARRFT